MSGSGGSPLLTISYRQLDAVSSRLAARLRDEGVAPGDLVGILMNRSAELIVAMLGILKAGAAYVPLDPAYPQERLDFMLADTRATVCLTQPELASRARHGASRVLVVDAPHAGDGASVAAPSVTRGADSPAYVIYTSGSTGRPKGVVVPHRAIVRLVREQSFARLDDSRVLLQLAPTSFDAATFEIWGALLNGARCVLAPDAGVPDLARLREVIVETGVTTMWLTASLFNTIVDQAPATLETVSEVLAGGESLSEPHVRKAMDLLPKVQFINGYGPTENTTFTCCYRIPRPLPPAWRSIPIGPAIAHTSVHLLDDALAPVAPGQAGDLCIGGDGLALGYLNHPELTAERFITSPRGGERLYRSGDRARLRDDGAYEFLGRLDDQVKIRGHRVELGEIEVALRAVPGIADAVVSLREDQPGDKRLVAYFRPADCLQPPSSSALRAHLLSRLPEYMVPSFFVTLDAIPLTPNGKADRRALPAPGRKRPVLDRDMVAPRTPVETWLAGLWRELLGLEELGVHDRFFELGGTSLTAMRLLARLREETGTPLPALLLFRAPTVAELSLILEREHGAVLPAAARPAGAVSVAAPSPLDERAARARDDLAARRMRRRRAV